MGPNPIIKVQTARGAREAARLEQVGVRESQWKGGWWVEPLSIHDKVLDGATLVLTKGLFSCPLPCSA